MDQKNIEIGNSVMTRYTIPAPEKKSSSQADKPGLKQKVLSLGDYESIYHNEPLYEVDGKKYPFALISSTKDPRTQTAELFPRGYVLPKGLQEVREEILRQKVRPGSFDGNCARAMDIQTDGEKTHVKMQHVGYFDHIATDLSKDVYLDQFCETFEPGKTLRDYEVVNGKAKPLPQSKLANLLCPPFIMVSMEKGKDYVVLAQRRKDLAIEGGTLGILGGTSEWEGIIKLGGDNWRNYFKFIADQEMREELSLNPDEFEIEKISWWKDFARAPDFLICMRTKVPIEEMIRRIEKNPEESQKEHPFIYKVPADPATIKAIRESKDFNFNNPSIVLLDWYFKS